MSSQTPILVVGAGPTGMNLALALAHRNVPFRFVTAADGPGEHSRAMVVQARTLEFYGMYGFADEMIQQGIVLHHAILREGNWGKEPKEVLQFSFNDLGTGLSPYPFALTFPQDDHERFLVKKLEEAGVKIEWGTKLTGFTQDDSGVTATVQRGAAPEEIRCDYIVGCDGAHSQVRQSLGIGFPGGTYEQVFFVADVKTAEGFNKDLVFNLGENILILMFPVRSSGMQRLIGLVPPELAAKEDLTFEDFRGQVEQLLTVHVTEVNWFSRYKVHHRVAEHFRVGRAFLCGDAAHIHSPVGGQGMNTGIGDAFNLGWKLASVVRGAALSLLDSYEPERIGFANSLVKTTDRVFTPIVAGGIQGEFMRGFVAPLIFGIATRFGVSRHAMFRVLSQIGIHYPESPLSFGTANDVHGGDRLPWTGENFEALRSLDWQVHVYGDVLESFKTACGELKVPLHVFYWNEAAKEAGLAENGFYLVRPDGYVGLASEKQDAAVLRAYFERVGLSFVS